MSDQEDNIREELQTDESSDGSLEGEPEAPQGNRVLSFFKRVAYTIYRGMYCTGGFLADLFGITTPRYDYVIREYEQRMREQREADRIAGGVGTQEDQSDTDSLPEEIQEREMNAPAE